MAVSVRTIQAVDALIRSSTSPLPATDLAAAANELIDAYGLMDDPLFSRGDARAVADLAAVAATIVLVTHYALEHDNIHHHTVSPLVKRVVLAITTGDSETDARFRRRLMPSLNITTFLDTRPELAPARIRIQWPSTTKERITDKDAARVALAALAAHPPDGRWNLRSAYPTMETDERREQIIALHALLGGGAVDDDNVDDFRHVCLVDRSRRVVMAMSSIPSIRDGTVTLLDPVSATSIHHADPDMPRAMLVATIATWISVGWRTFVAQPTHPVFQRHYQELGFAPHTHTLLLLPVHNTRILLRTLRQFLRAAAAHHPRTRSLSRSRSPPTQRGRAKRRKR